MLVLKIKKKNYIFEGAPKLWCLGTRTLVPQPFFGVFFLYYEPVCAGNALIKLGNMGDSKRHLEKKRISNSLCWFLRF